VAVVDYLDTHAYHKAIAEASLVIAHAGAGILISCLRASKPVVLMPRDKRRAEIDSDHQNEMREIVAAMGIQDFVQIATNATELEEAARNLLQRRNSATLYVSDHRLVANILRFAERMSGSGDAETRAESNENTHHNR